MDEPPALEHEPKVSLLQADQDRVADSGLLQASGAAVATALSRRNVSIVPRCSKRPRPKGWVICATSTMSHYVAYHPNLPRPGAHHTPDPVVRKLKSGEKADWSCRLCKVGIPSGATAPVSHRRFYVAREGHRKQAHPKLSAKKFKKLETLRMTRDPKIVMKHRARMLNKSRAKHLSGDALPGVLAFSWPHPRKRKASDGLDTKLVLKSAWRCSKCVYRTRSPTEAKRHTCGGLLLPKFIKARVAQLKKMRKQVAKLQHGIAADLLEGVFTKALDMVGGDSVDP